MTTSTLPAPSANPVVVSGRIHDARHFPGFPRH